MSCQEKCICGTRGREWETKNWCLLQKTVNQPVKMPTEKQIWQMELADEMRGRMRDWPQFMREAVMEVFYNSTKQGAQMNIIGKVLATVCAVFALPIIFIQMVWDIWYN